jgi:hypothetical protein
MEAGSGAEQRGSGAQCGRGGTRLEPAASGNQQREQVPASGTPMRRSRDTAAAGEADRWADLLLQ